MEEISLITFLSCIMSRLVYFNNNDFLPKYTRIMDIPELSEQLKNIKDVSSLNIFKPKTANLLKISKQVNKINYSKKLSANTNNNNNNNNEILSNAVKYIILSTSNYSSVYLVADKRTNTLFIAFRGTSSLKSGLSYAKLTSSLPFRTCSKNKNGYLLGIFKIVGEMFYTISEGIHYLIHDFLNSSPTKIKLVTTGHSLGGGCAQVFSYLWIQKNPSSNIACITFGSPRVMNGHLIEEYIRLIHQHKIQYERIVTDGDPFPKLPFKTRGTSKTRTYYHVDDIDSTLQLVALFCTNYKKTRKLQCNVKNKTKRAKVDIKNHGNYLSINYDKAALGLTDTKKEIRRDSRSNTICRVIMGGDNQPSKVSFFNLQEVKSNPQGILQKLTRKISKKFMTDYTHQDVFMNTTIFNTIIKEGVIISEDNLNPLQTDTYVSIDVKETSKPKESLICL